MKEIITSCSLLSSELFLSFHSFLLASRVIDLVVFSHEREKTGYHDPLDEGKRRCDSHIEKQSRLFLKCFPIAIIIAMCKKNPGAFFQKLRGSL